MGKYNEIGVDKKGNVDPLRQLVHDMVGNLNVGGGTGTREMADDLYSWMKKNKGGGGKDDGKDDGKGDFGNEGPGTVVHGGGRRNNYDVDFTMKGEMRRPPKWDSGYKPGSKGDRIENLIGNTRDPDRFKMGKGIIPKNPLKVSGATTMKQGGLVRGAGCAQRGRGKGKMV